VVIFSLPLARKQFRLDPSNVEVTSTALGIGLLGVAAVEAVWWIRARVLGVQPRLWR
jgi:cation-transporting ATPase E